MSFAGISIASAQEVYTSSGKPGNHKKAVKKKKKGYDPDRLIIGGGLNAGYSGDFANAGISPIVGYRITDHFSAGIGLGYQFYKFPAGEYNYKLYYSYENILYPSVWTRYFVYKNFFVSGSFEYHWINLKEPFDYTSNLHTTRSSHTNPCLLMGAGIRQPLGGRVSAYAELIYDVLQGKYSPYPKGGPDIRIGFVMFMDVLV